MAANGGVDSPLRELAKCLKTEWPSILAAEKITKKKRTRLRKLFENGMFDSTDRSIVAFGSIAREEWTSASDLDWTLLIDGLADPQHLSIAQGIREALLHEGFEDPGPTGIFGNMAFSHEIIHNIGGQHDTNRNTTQRILLLLESTSVGSTSVAYDRVVSGVLNRYLEEDTSFLTPDGRQRIVPRFLLNDIVRFWRTMAVDFASKQRERAGEGWALRNVKLRMSRKLIFCSGLLMCFSCYNDLDGGSPRAATSSLELVNHLKGYVNLTPLEILAKALLVYNESDKNSKAVFSAYDRFLALIDDTDKRTVLKTIKSADAPSNAVFNEARDISQEFQEALTQFFFNNQKLSHLTKKYGVF